MKPQIKQTDCKFIVKPEERMVICVIDNNVSDMLLNFIQDEASFNDIEIYSFYDFDKKLRMPHSFMGKAICAPEDEWDEALGRKIAYSRAKNKLYTSFFKRANLFIQTIDKRLGDMIEKFNDFGTALDNNRQKLDDEIERALQKQEE